MNKENTQNVNKNFYQGYEMWKKLLETQVEHMQNFYKELERYENHGIEQAKQAIDEGARIMKDSLALTTQFATTGQKLALETTRRLGEMVGTIIPA